MINLEVITILTETYKKESGNAKIMNDYIEYPYFSKAIRELKRCIHKENVDYEVLDFLASNGLELEKLTSKSNMDIHDYNYTNFQMFKDAREYCRKNNHLIVLCAQTKKEILLARALKRNRTEFLRGTLSKDIIKRLDSISFTWRIPINTLSEYAKTRGIALNKIMKKLEEEPYIIDYLRIFQITDEQYGAEKPKDFKSLKFKRQ